MQVEVSRTDGYFQIKIPIIDTYTDRNIRNFLNYLKLREIASKSQATDNDIEALSEEIMQEWWNSSGEKFFK